MITPNDSDPQRRLAAAAGDLLGDLETIRELLEEASDGDPAGMEARESLDSRDGVPLLDDPVDETQPLKEVTFSGVAASLGHPGGRRKADRLSAELFEHLLGEEWKASASHILAGAREAIQDHRDRWTPADTDELNEALRVRIDTTLTEWLRSTVSEHVEELRDELLTAAEAAINEKIEALLERGPPEDFPEGPS